MLKRMDNNELSQRERELAAIGAAIASNCVPCIEYHIPAARKAGLSDAQILEAVKLAEKVRKVPADKVLTTARALLEVEKPSESPAEAGACGCSRTPTESGGTPGVE